MGIFMAATHFQTAVLQKLFKRMALPSFIIYRDMVSEEKPFLGQIVRSVLFQYKRIAKLDLCAMI